MLLVAYRFFRKKTLFWLVQNFNLPPVYLLTLTLVATASFL